MLIQARDRKGREFVAIIEARHYPFYGVQWHPERDSSMDALVKFFLQKKKLKKQKKNLLKLNITEDTQRMTSKKLIV